MSIDYLYDIERDVDSGKDMYACPGLGKNQWVISRSIDELKKVARRTAEHRKTGVTIVRLIPKSDTIMGNNFLVPIRIGDPGVRGEPQIEWATIETKEAADNMKDVRRGPAPFFGMQVEDTIEPKTA